MQEIQNTLTYSLIAFLVCAAIEGVKRWYLTEDIQASLQDTYQDYLGYLQMLTLTWCGLGMITSLLSMPFVWSLGTSITLVALWHILLRFYYRGDR
jgi:hypothetical protein